MSNEKAKIERSVREKINRSLAYVGIGGAMAGAMVGATLSRAESAQAAGATPTAIEKDPIYQMVRGSLVGAIEAANKSKKPNIFYGAIVLDKNYLRLGTRFESSIFLSPTKDLRYRPETSVAGPVALVNPVIEEYNGRLYAITYNRGDVYYRDHPDSGLVDQNPKDAATTGAAIWENRLIDLGAAYKSNNSRLYYYSENHQTPQMVKSGVSNGQRYINGGERFPQMTDVGGFWWGFTSSYPTPDEDTFDIYMANKGFVLQDGYTPPFQHQMVKESKTVRIH